MEITDFAHTRLKFETILKPFKCRDADLNGFLIDDAKKFLKELIAVTYLIEYKSAIVAYYSLFNDKISVDLVEQSIWNKLNRRIPN